MLLCLNRHTELRQRAHSRFDVAGSAWGSKRGRDKEKARQLFGGWIVGNNIFRVGLVVAVDDMHGGVSLAGAAVRRAVRPSLHLNEQDSS